MEVPRNRDTCDVIYRRSTTYLKTIGKNGTVRGRAVDGSMKFFRHIREFTFPGIFCRQHAQFLAEFLILRHLSIILGHIL